MKETSMEMQRFFKDYERFANVDDPAGIVSQFAETFMTADAAGCRVVSTEQLAAGVAKRKKMFDAAGSRTTSLVSIETRDLTHDYVLAETEWSVRFNDRAEDIPLRSSFIVHRSEHGPRIVFYLMHQNPMTVLKERGILE